MVTTTPMFRIKTYWRPTLKTGTIYSSCTCYAADHIMQWFSMFIACRNTSNCIIATLLFRSTTTSCCIRIARTLIPCCFRIIMWWWNEWINMSIKISQVNSNMHFLLFCLLSIFNEKNRRRRYILRTFLDNNWPFFQGGKTAFIFHSPYVGKLIT